MKKDEAERAFSQLVHLGPVRIVCPGKYGAGAVAVFEGGMGSISRKTRYAWAWSEIMDFRGVVTHRKYAVSGITVGKAVQPVYTVTSINGDTVRLDSLLTDVEQLAALVDDASFEHRLAFRISQIENDGSSKLTGSPSGICLRPEGLQQSKALMPWASITGTTPAPGAMLVEGTTTEGKSGHIAAYARDVDLRVLAALIPRYQQLAASARPTARQPS